MDDRPLKREYARIERERRFLLAELPAAVDAEDFERLRDLFVTGTHLRLRRVEAPDGSLIVAKLGQKILDPAAPDDPRRRQMTTIYLDGIEADALGLQGVGAVKRRYKLAEQGHTFCIDAWEAPACGVILAEVKCDSDAELAAVRCPDWAVREVTEDPAYSAIALATTGPGCT